MGKPDHSKPDLFGVPCTRWLMCWLTVLSRTCVLLMVIAIHKELQFSPGAVDVLIV